MQDEVWISLKTIKETYPTYEGEWPISHYCSRRKKIFPNTKLYVTDRHGPNTWDFYVPDVGKQAKWFEAYATRKNVVLDNY